MPGAPATEQDGLSPEAVAEWLARHPRFLADQPDLYRHLAPPRRVHGEVLADHMAAMLQAERTQAAAARAHADGVLAAGRAAAGFAARVQDAVLALIAAADPVECVTAELPTILRLDAARVCAEAPTLPGARMVPPGTVGRLLGGRAVLFRESGAEALLLHGEAAPLAWHDALVRVPGARPALLALAARDRGALDPRQGAGALAFLGQAVAMALRR